MGFFRELYGFVEELGELIDDSVNEFRELMTDGFVEMVIKDNSDYETSYEKRDRADSIIFSARSSLEDKIDEVTHDVELTNELINNHYEYKLNILEGPLKETKLVLSEFIKINIDTKIVEDPVHKGMRDFEASLNIGTKMVAETLVASFTNGLRLGPDIGGVFSDLLEQQERVEKSIQYLEDARDYAAQTRLREAELESLKSRMFYIRQCINEESKLLEILLAKLHDLTNQTKNNINQGSFTPEEANKAKATWEIAEAVKEACTCIMLNDKQNDLSQQYQETLKNIKTIARNIDEGRPAK